MKKFKKIDEKKFKEILNATNENSLLKTVLGGSTVVQCSKTIAFANSTYYNNPYYNRI